MESMELFVNMLSSVFVILTANTVWHFITNYKIVKK